MVSHTKKFIFFHNPKTAGTSIFGTLHDHGYGHYVGKQMKWKHLIYDFDTHPKLKSLAATFKGEMMAHGNKKEDYLKFSVVRNPYDRLVSYCYMRTMGQVNYKTLLRFSDTSRGRGTLKEQHVYCGDGSHTDFLIRFENLQEDFNEFCDMVDIPRLTLLHRLKSSKRKPFIKYLNKENIDLINERYSKDFEYFGYEKLEL